MPRTGTPSDASNTDLQVGAGKVTHRPGGRCYIAFLCPYPFGTAPGQRFRYELFLKNVGSDALDWQVFSFLDEATNRILYQPGQFFPKTWGVFKGFLRRIGFLFVVWRFDFIFVFREITPLGPPVFEWLLAKVFRKKLIYDFDDAIWLSNTTSENRVAGWLKWHSKVAQICKWSYKVAAGNSFLADFARQKNGQVVVLPTIVDTAHAHNQLKNHELKIRPTIGWTGTHSTLKYLKKLLPVFQKLEQTHEFELLVIADKNPDFQISNFKFCRWQEATEIEDLLRMDIGLMPLNDTDWERGKCGFKAIQYMALGIPAVASPVGVNSKIIDNQRNGFLCDSHDEWLAALKTLLDHTVLRQQMGAAARQKIESEYSEIANRDLFLSLFL